MMSTNNQLQGGSKAIVDETLTAARDKPDSRTLHDMATRWPPSSYLQGRQLSRRTYPTMGSRSGAIHKLKRRAQSKRAL